ncbi:hypothetical protein [Mesobacterium pallidum]|nr:hypothetical protein [Mesobacterium pallidum]
MTNKLALWLGGLILLFLLGDYLLTGGAAALFLAREFADLLNWVAFWR